jgi:hypothetical protein
MSLTKVYYKSMQCFAMDSPTKGPACSAKVSPTKGPSCTMWFRRFTKYVTMYDANPHSTGQGTQHITFLISKEAIPYQTRGGTCCLVVSIPKIRSLADLSTTCMTILTISTIPTISQITASILIRSPHISTDETTTLSQRHKPYSTS